MSETEFEAFMRHYEAQQDAQRRAATDVFARKTVPMLAKLGIRKIDIEYSGSGDSGGVDHETYYGDGDTVIATVVVDQQVRDLVLGYAEKLIPAGFENNDGGQGVLKIDVVKGAYKLHHENNVMSVESSDSEGKF